MEWGLGRSDGLGQRCALGCPFYLSLPGCPVQGSVTSLQTPWTSSLVHLRKMEQWSKLPSWACLMQAVLSMRDAGRVWAVCGLHFQFHQLVRCLLLTLWWVSFLFVQGATVHVLLFWQVQLISVLSGATLNPCQLHGIMRHKVCIYLRPQTEGN